MNPLLSAWPHVAPAELGVPPGGLCWDRGSGAPNASEGRDGAEWALLGQIPLISPATCLAWPWELLPSPMHRLPLPVGLQRGWVAHQKALSSWECWPRGGVGPVGAEVLEELRNKHD